MKLDELKKIAAGPVVLLADRLNANRQPCAAGTQISPNIDGWPEGRVMQALLHGYAGVMPASQMAPAKVEEKSKPKKQFRVEE